jgi:hypothetical protein
MQTGLTPVNTLTGIQEDCQASTTSEVLVGIGLTQGSSATSVLSVPSSIGTLVSWGLIMAVS